MLLVLSKKLTTTIQFRFNIGTLNVCGLGNRIKRCSIFNYFRDKNLDVIFVQETHCTRKTKKLWQSEWVGNWLSSSGNSQARGVAILFKPDSKFSIVKSYTDDIGRYVICNVERENVKYTLCNIYAPNQDDPEFFHSVFKTLEKVATENVIIGGDFNLTLDPELDRFNCKSNSNNDRSTTYVKAFMDEFNLHDIWRDRNEDVKRYTWFRKQVGNRTASRLDYFLISAGVCNKVCVTDIVGNVKTDHSMVVVSINENANIRGPGIWRLNNKVLQDCSIMGYYFNCCVLHMFKQVYC